MRGNNRTRRRVALTPLLFVHCLPQIGLSPQFYRQQISEIGVKTKRSDKDKARRGPGFSGVPMSGLELQMINQRSCTLDPWCNSMSTYRGVNARLP